MNGTSRTDTPAKTVAGFFTKKVPQNRFAGLFARIEFENISENGLRDHVRDHVPTPQQLLHELPKLHQKNEGFCLQADD